MESGMETKNNPKVFQIHMFSIFHLGTFVKPSIFYGLAINYTYLRCFCDGRIRSESRKGTFLATLLTKDSYLRNDIILQTVDFPRCFNALFAV